MHYILFLLALVPFYLLGAFPTGRLVAKAQGLDISQHGSGNTGATNVARVAGKRAGLLTLAGDVGKGLLGIAIAKALIGDEYFIACASFTIVAGHCFSIPGKLKGGKGVATALGVLLGSTPISAVLAVAVFALVFWLLRIVSAASISAALSAPIIAMLLQVHDSLTAALVAIAFLICARHHENIRRLVEGREPKFSAG